MIASRSAAPTSPNNCWFDESAADSKVGLIRFCWNPLVSWKFLRSKWVSAAAFARNSSRRACEMAINCPVFELRIGPASDCDPREARFELLREFRGRADLFDAFGIRRVYTANSPITH